MLNTIIESFYVAIQIIHLPLDLRSISLALSLSFCWLLVVALNIFAILNFKCRIILGLCGTNNVCLSISQRNMWWISFRFVIYGRSAWVYFQMCVIVCVSNWNMWRWSFPGNIMTEPSGYNELTIVKQHTNDLKSLCISNNKRPVLNAIISFKIYSNMNQPPQVDHT